MTTIEDPKDELFTCPGCGKEVPPWCVDLCKWCGEEFCEDCLTDEPTGLYCKDCGENST